jgi:CRP-like cAMP-binding protein
MAEERYVRTVPAGTVIFREGDPGDEMYVVQSGRVQITRHGGGTDVVIAVLPSGEFFGEMAIINRRPRVATATTLEETRLLCIHAEKVASMLRENAEVAVRLIQKLAARLEQANEQVDVLLLKDVNHRVVFALRRLAETQGTPEPGGVRIQVSISELAGRVGLEEVVVRQAVARLARARLVVGALAPTHGTNPGFGAGLGAPASFLIPEVGKLQEFQEFLELKERYGGAVT